MNKLNKYIISHKTVPFSATPPRPIRIVFKYEILIQECMLSAPVSKNIQAFNLQASSPICMQAL
jgi:hypothetical protein